ncbi:MAG: hypothetical protein HY899_03365 [Deltaproteobacteria bacterium]|nr:hypothetical protein [Deltaproteobacteria bacterium]
MEEYISPYDERSLGKSPLAPRLKSLSGKRVTLLSIRKPKSAEFLGELGRILGEQHGALVSYDEKPTFTRPAPPEVIERLRAGADAVVEGLAD